MSKNVVSSLEIGAYVVYDTVLQEYSTPFCVSVSALENEMKSLINDVSSRYYGNENDYILFKVGTFDKKSGLIHYSNFEKIGSLGLYVDDMSRKVQICIKTLNYLPVGYFKMPEEMKKDIQSQIDEQIKVYSELFIKPSLTETQSSTN